MDASENDQLSATLRDADTKCAVWANGLGVSIHRFQHVTDLAPPRRDVWVWVFFTTDEELQAQVENGFTEQLKAKYREMFAAAARDSARSLELHFRFDSHQNVQENFEEGYFYRMR